MHSIIVSVTAEVTAC